MQWYGETLTSILRALGANKDNCDDFEFITTRREFLGGEFHKSGVKVGEIAAKFQHKESGGFIFSLKFSSEEGGSKHSIHF